MVSVKPLLSGPQCMLYGRLVRAFPGHVVLAHVPLACFMVSEAPADGDGAAAAGGAKTASTRFRQMVADFVICRSDFTALAVIELDAPRAPRDMHRDSRRRKDQLLQSAGVKVIHLTAADIPGEPGLKALVATLPLHTTTAELMRRAS